MADIVPRLRAFADDPMWADHAEIPKSLLRMAIAEIERLRGVAGPFICGTVGKADTGGLHDGYVICPQFGADYIAVFMQKRIE